MSTLAVAVCFRCGSPLYIGQRVCTRCGKELKG